MLIWNTLILAVNGVFSYYSEKYTRWIIVRQSVIRVDQRSSTNTLETLVRSTRLSSQNNKEFGDHIYEGMY